MNDCIFKQKTNNAFSEYYYHNHAHYIVKSYTIAIDPILLSMR